MDQKKFENHHCESSIMLFFNLLKWAKSEFRDVYLKKKKKISAFTLKYCPFLFFWYEMLGPVSFK